MVGTVPTGEPDDRSAGDAVRVFSLCRIDPLEREPLGAAEPRVALVPVALPIPTRAGMGFVYDGRRHQPRLRNERTLARAVADFRSDGHSAAGTEREINVVVIVHPAA